MTMRHYIKEQPISFWRCMSDNYSHETKWPVVILNFFILGIPRMSLAIVSYSGVYIVSIMINLLKYTQNSDSKWDKYSYLLQFLYFLYKLIWRVHLMHIGIMPLNIQYYGESEIEESCPILISLHYTYTDGAIAFSLNHISYLQARYIYESFIINNVFSVEDPIPVDKYDPKDKVKALKSIYKHVHTYYNRKGKYNRLFIYPEGNHGGMNSYILPFKAGAFSALAPMKFVKMNYHYDSMTKIYPSSFRSIVEEYLMAISRCWLVIELDYSETFEPDQKIDYSQPFDQMMAEVKSNLDQYKRWSQEYMQKVSAKVNLITGVEFLPSFKEKDCGEAKEFWTWVYEHKLYEFQSMHSDKQKVKDLMRQWVNEGHRNAYLEKLDPSIYRTQEEFVLEIEESE